MLERYCVSVLVAFSWISSFTYTQLVPHAHQSVELYPPTLLSLASSRILLQCESKSVPFIFSVPLYLRGGARSKRKVRAIRQLHNYVPKQKRAGQNPLQTNKAHRMRKKEKDRHKAKKKTKGALSSVRLEDREDLYDRGILEKGPERDRRSATEREQLARGHMQPDNLEDIPETDWAGTEIEEKTEAGEDDENAEEDILSPLFESDSDDSIDRLFKKHG
eukprot:1920858-Rhodomonas_salina.4